MSRSIKILIADDLKANREGLRRLLASSKDIKIVGEAETVAEVPTLIRQKKPDIAIIDLKWRGSEYAGLKLIERIRTEHLPVKIILLTAHPTLLNGYPQSTALADRTLLNGGISREALLTEIHTLFMTPSAPKQQSTSLVSTLAVLSACFLVLVAAFALLIIQFGILSAREVIVLSIGAFTILVSLSLLYLRRVKPGELFTLIKELFTHMLRS